MIRTDKLRVTTYMDSITEQMAAYFKRSHPHITLCNPDGVKTDGRPHGDSIGILRKNYIKPWFGRRMFVGVLEVSCDGTGPRKELIFNVYGDRQLEFAEHLCRDLILKFGIPIHIHVEKGERFEGEVGVHDTKK